MSERNILKQNILLTHKETDKKNIASIERIIRIVAGFGILSLAFIGPETEWGYLGLILLATGLIGWCSP
jgi:hypothetical protein